jgi:hypothetical protein
MRSSNQESTTPSVGLQHRPLLVADDATGWARPTVAGAGRQRRRAEWADRVRSRRDRLQHSSQGRPQGTKDANHQNNRRGGRGDAAEPTAERELRVWRDHPENDRNGDKAVDASPLDGAAHLRSDAGISIADAADPVSPETDGQNGDPENVSHIEGPYRDGAARAIARYAVVIAKGHPLWPEMVGAVNQEHGDSSNRFVEERAAVY